MAKAIVRSLTDHDKPDWLRLWAGYLKFYRSELASDVTESTWQRLMAADSGMDCLVAAQDGRVIGICHFLYHASTWHTQPICYLQDLYVDPDARGSGAAKALILACEAEAKAAGAARLYWQTQEFNGPARSLYDTIVPRSSFIVYRKPLI